MTVASGSTLGVVEFASKLKFALFVACYHHLRDAFALGNDEVVGGKIDKQHAYLAAIVGINGAGRVEDGDSMLQSQTTSGTHLEAAPCTDLSV